MKNLGYFWKDFSRDEEKKKVMVSIKRERYRGRYYVTQREGKKERVFARVRWKQGETPRAKSRYVEKVDGRARRSIVPGERVTIFRNFYEVVANKKRSSRAYQVSSTILFKNGISFSRRSDKRVALVRDQRAEARKRAAGAATQELFNDSDPELLNELPKGGYKYTYEYVRYVRR